MKKASSALVLGLFFSLLFLGTSALSIATPKEEYSKGEEITVSGDCSGSVGIAFWNVRRKVVEGAVDCVSGQYSFAYQSSAADPSGQWQLFAREKGMEKSVRARVAGTRESFFYVITFLSPSTETHYRGQDTTISVRVSDAGTNIDGAEVFFWDTEGNRLQLNAAGKGTYVASYSIPIGANLGDWPLFVTAAKETFGGEEQRNIVVKKAPLQLEVVKPTLTNFETGSMLELEARAGYLNGTPLGDANALMLFGDASIEMQNLGGGVFAASIELGKQHIGPKKLVVSISDAFGNDNSTELDVIVGQSTVSMLMDALPFVAAAIVAALVVLFVVRPRLKEKSDVSSLKKRKKDLKEKIAKLQDDYFEKGRIKKEAYQQRLAELNEELSEVKKKLKIR